MPVLNLPNMEQGGHYRAISMKLKTFVFCCFILREGKCKVAGENKIPFSGIRSGGKRLWHLSCRFIGEINALLQLYLFMYSY
jgi:hypothetical protein